jgi:putative transposase
MSIEQQCALLDVPRSSWYYKPQSTSTYTELLMRLIDEQFTRTPFYGSRKITAWLHNEGHEVNRKRVRRLTQLLGLETIYAKPRTTIPSKQHKKYPYLLRGLKIERPNQVWSTDITYIRMKKGFVYLTAVIDWYSRYVLSWELSNTLDTSFCLEALEKALKVATPEIFNTDQGVQFTSDDFTSRLLKSGIAISMDGRGRALDNVFVERLWRSVKYEEVYIKDYEGAPSAFEGLKAYFRFYNDERLHQSLGYKTPKMIYGDITLKKEIFV